MTGDWVVVSAFRNSSRAQMDRWIGQIHRLRVVAHGIVIPVAVVGDCRPGYNNADYLEGEGAAVVRYDHGGPEFGSVESAQRMQQLSGVGNAMLDAAAKYARVGGLVFYVESDLIWSPETALSLGGTVYPRQLDIAAPMIFAGEHFYDVWGFRADGQRFSPFPPYSHALTGEKFSYVDSVGSAFVTHREVVTDGRLRMTDGALVEFCGKAKRFNYRIGVVPAERVEHPA